ncbi:hypothetical protein [Psychroflexus sp. MES1-P1E]|uniref:hypothetical protein n=1 Tax=Psychroflexus sp. MES1-P1E TaxID=2058320 RepID=UPI000C7DAFC9|nr:hypothetical protein [Psychroflexus sp. MES1-P1E]PKG41462.1 hypothetical protein CXF67_15515 [Psychroflexus sp. MES1-P1E]
MKAILSIFLFFTVIFHSFGQTEKIEVKVKLHSIEGYGQYEDLANQAIIQLEKAINSDEFRQGMIYGNFIKTNDLTNKELFYKIILAHEEQGPGGKDTVIDLRVRTLRINSDESRWKNKCKIGSNSGTIGIDGNGDGVTAICPQRLKKWKEENNVADLAGHYAHEYMHILGFGHYKFLSRDKWRQKTFVYKIGNLVSNLVRKEMKK